MVSIKEFINNGCKCDVIFKGNSSVELTVATDGAYSFDRYLAQALVLCDTLKITYNNDVFDTTGPDAFLDILLNDINKTNKISDVIRKANAYIKSEMADEYYRAEFGYVFSDVMDFVNSVYNHEFVKYASDDNIAFLDDLLSELVEEKQNQLLKSVRYVWLIVSENTDEFLTKDGSRLYYSKEQLLGSAYVTEQLAELDLEDYCASEPAGEYMYDSEGDDELFVSPLKIGEYIDMMKEDGVTAAIINGYSFELMYTWLA